MSDTIDDVALRRWGGGDLAVLRMLNNAELRPEPDGRVFRRHGRYLDGWRDRTSFNHVVTRRGEPIGVVGYGYALRLGVVVYEIGWRMLPGADATAAVRELLRHAAAHPIPRFVIATIHPDDRVAARVCRDSGFEWLGEEDGVVVWRYDLAA
ncbi:GNAT family N-acetyltransferase [Microbacteriaceae bacterium VKM Ac-2854]|nr:GNAT family N-acetyltransferase [Microbacteriaceae bacterium VKM Ac-2854]